MVTDAKSANNAFIGWCSLDGLFDDNHIVEARFMRIKSSTEHRPHHHRKVPSPNWLRRCTGRCSMALRRLVENA